MNKKLLADKVIVVSGGTKGIGKGIVIAAAEHGARVFFGGRDDFAAGEIVEGLKKNGLTADFVHTDVRIIDDIKRLFAEAAKKGGRIDGFVSYAGVTNVASMVDCEEETFDQIFDVNVKGTFFAAQCALKHMMNNASGGSIVIFGSPHDDKGQIDRAPYAFSKAALSVMVTHMAKYYAPYSIRTNYITPGWTPTEGELTLRKKQGMSEAELRKIAEKEIPIGRMSEVEDHIPAVLYLLSDLSQVVTGSNIRVSGGLYF